MPEKEEVKKEKSEEIPMDEKNVRKRELQEMEAQYGRLMLRFLSKEDIDVEEQQECWEKALEVAQQIIEKSK